MITMSLLGGFHGKKYKTKKYPPNVSGPRGVDWARCVWEMRSDPLEALTELRQNYGNLSRFYHPGVMTHAYVPASPDYVQQILHDNQDNYRKADTYRELQPILGKGLLTSEGDLWRRQRRLIAPMFHRKSIRRFARIMVDQTRSLIDRWEDYQRRGAKFDLDAEMRRLTFSIIGRALFSTDLEEKAPGVSEALRVLRRDVLYRTTSPIAIPTAVPTPWNRRVIEARRRLHKLVEDLIDRRRGQVEEYEDLLSMLMGARDEETGRSMPETQVRDEVMTFLLAGHETTASALSWSWYLLSQHDHTHRKLHDVVTRLPGEVDGLFELLTEPNHVKQVVEESMRLYPPAWVIERTPRKDDELGGHRIPAGSLLMVSPYVVHRHPDLWDKPRQFKPDRFTPERSERRHRFAYFPFGGGGRICIGREFAMMEAQIVLRLVVDPFRVEQAPGTDVEPEAAVTLHPKSGFQVTVHDWAD